MLKWVQPEWVKGLKLSKYLKPRFTSWLLLFNCFFLLYTLTPLTLFQLLPLLVLAVSLLKPLRMAWIYGLVLADPKECASSISARIDLELLNFCWLVNKLNVRCFCFVVSLAGVLYFTEKLAGVEASWWLFGNLSLLYLGATKTSKGMMKYWLRLYREYKKYVIHVIEPNSPERRDREEREDESEEEIPDLSEK